MTAVGLVRKFDHLGRIVLPKALRDSLEIHMGTSVAIYVEGDSIILEKERAHCFLCGGFESVNEVMDKKICSSCLEELKKLG